MMEFVPALIFIFFIFWGMPLSMLLYNLADLIYENGICAKHYNVDWFESHGYQKRWYGYVKPKNKKGGC